jgi:hypothetical protein
VVRDWFWEGNVQARIAAWLVEQGWQDLRVADTASRERGVDILAGKGSRRLAVEVKGWPTTTYARGPLAGEPKPTPPTSQAGKWFSHALLTVLTTLQSRPDHEVAIGLPDMPRFRRLVAATDQSLSFLGVGVLLVRQDDAIEVLLPIMQRERRGP